MEIFKTFIYFSADPVVNSLEVIRVKRVYFWLNLHLCAGSGFQNNYFGEISISSKKVL